MPIEEEPVAAPVSAKKSAGLKYPMSGFQAGNKVPDTHLTAFERTEVDEFEEVWFVAPDDKKYKPTKLERLVNNGFDDDEGYYRFQEGDQIAYRYENVEVIGKGAFGNVLKCFDHKTK